MSSTSGHPYFHPAGSMVWENMVFASPLFLFAFLPAVFLAYFLVPVMRWRNAVLVVSSLLFYTWGEGYYVFVMLFTIVLNYFLGLAIERTKGSRWERQVVAGAVAANLCILGFYKYANFVVDNLNMLLGVAHLPLLKVSAVHLPIGISFFTFQAISYVLDVSRGVIEAQRSVFLMALYKSLFPQLIAGPVVRYKDVARDMNNRRVDPADCVTGIERFILGLSKKVLLANPFGNIADQVFTTQTSDLSSAVAWIGAISYFFQIYFDFSGYSDMAIGLGRMFGFHFLENFNYPYVSSSITEFWRRWHISLSSWFRDYLYIPLGGNRGSPWRTYGNLVIVFFLCGLWHGANWHFVVWGLFHGFFLVVERAFLGEVLNRIPWLIRRAYSLVVVLIGWVLFRADTLSGAVQFLRAMFGLGHGKGLLLPAGQLATHDHGVLAVIALLVSMGVWPWLEVRVFGRGAPAEAGPRRELPGLSLSLGVVRQVALLVLCVCSMSFLAASTFNPFIYFRF